MFEIGDGATSKTQVPGFFPMDMAKKTVYISDCPGFNDSNMSSEYPN